MLDDSQIHAKEGDDPPPESTPGAGGCFPGPLAALALYVFLAVALTWPLVFRMGTHLPAGDNDLWQNYWNFWWWEEALVSRHQLPYHTDLMYQPGEVSLAFHTHSEANIIIVFPVLLLFGVPAALNLATILGFIIAGWGGYFLAREVVRDRRAAFLGGIVLAFFPQHFEQSLEHLNLASYQAIPFFLLFFSRLARRGGWGNLTLAALFFAYDSLLSWHDGLLAFPAAAVLLAWELGRASRPRLAILRDVAAAALLSLGILLPFAWPMLREMLAGATYYLKGAVQRGIDPTFLVLPCEGHPFWGGLFQGFYDSWRTYAAAGFTAYVGAAAAVLWILGGVQGWMARRDARAPQGGARADTTHARAPAAPPAAGAAPAGAALAQWLLWTGLFFLCALLALGDPLVVAGKETALRGPFALWSQVPVLKTIRVANRFMVPAMVALSVLAALGARGILGPSGSRRGLLKLLALAGILILDFLWLPYPTRPVPEPGWMGALSRCTPGLLLDIPGGYSGRGAEDLFLQTLHRRPIVGGYASCVPPQMRERVEKIPFLKLIFEGRPKEVPSSEAELEDAIRQALEELPVSVVVLHLERTRERLADLHAKARGTSHARLFNPEKGIPEALMDSIRKALEKLWGKPVYEDASVALFQRP